MRKSKGLTGTVLVVVAAICVQRYARGFLTRKKYQSRRSSFHAAGVAKRAAVCASKIILNLQVHLKIIQASSIASCASKHAVQQALLARSCCDDVMKRREQDQAALLSAVAAFAANVASRSAMKISEEVSLEISKLKRRKEVQEQEKKKKKKKKKVQKKKNKRKILKKQEEEKKIDDAKSLPFLPTSVQYWSPIQKVSTQNGIPETMIVRAQHQNNSQKEETTLRRSLSPPRRMKIECDEISQRILSPIGMNKGRSNLNNNMKEKKRKASKLIDKFENIQNDHSESDLTRGEEPKRLVLETHQVDVTTPLTPSSCADIKIEESKEEVSSETPQKSLRRLRHRQQNNGLLDQQKGGENSCACACVVM